MKRKGFFYSLLLSLIFLLTMANNAAADTTISGIINNDTTWTLVNSPYIAVGNILVSEGVTLSIEPGLEVRFDSAIVLQVEGTLIARGTSENLITFTSNQSSPAPGDWGYIYFMDTSTDATFDSDGNYTGGSILEYCVVEYAGGLSGDYNGSVKISGVIPFINYCTIQHNSASGIYAGNLSGILKVTNSIISDNSNKGIYAFGVSTLTVSTNTVSDNYEGGIYVSDSGTVTISDNTVTDNDGSGIYAWDSDKVNISNNAVRNNTGYPGYSYGGGISACADSTANISNNTVKNNRAYYGGGIYASASNIVTISDNIIIGNSAISYGLPLQFDNYGGGIYASGNIFNNIISNNDAQYAGGIYGSGTISNNIISNNDAGKRYYCDTNICYYITGYGGGIYGDGNEVAITANSIIQNTASHASAVYHSGQSFSYNTIAGNTSTGTEPTHTVYVDSHPLFNYNNIFDNTATYELYNANSAGSKDVNAENNWWGTDEESEIQAKIYDWFDDGTKGFVDYTPFLTSLDTTAPISPPLGLKVVETAGRDSKSIKIQWDANHESDIAGYMVYWDTDDELPYDNVVDVGNVTSYAITGLTPDTYYVAVTAYDNDYDPGNDDPDTIVNENQTNGNESWYSSSAEYEIKPKPLKAMPWLPLLLDD